MLRLQGFPDTYKIVVNIIFQNIGKRFTFGFRKRVGKFKFHFIKKTAYYNTFSFPDTYKIVVNYGHIKHQTGNSVAVPLISAVARQMVLALKTKENNMNTDLANAKAALVMALNISSWNFALELHFLPSILMLMSSRQALLFTQFQNGKNERQKLP